MAHYSHQKYHRGRATFGKSLREKMRRSLHIKIAHETCLLNDERDRKPDLIL